MTNRATTLAATVAAFTAAVAVAVAAPSATTPSINPIRSAVIVDGPTSTASGVHVVRVGSAAEAGAAAARLAATGYDQIDAIGPLARSGLAEARAAGLLATR